ncbi:MAG: hypothetical protein R2769_00160 [Saprospiraceae bacterium]
MKSFKWIFLVLFSATMLTSCFEIIEEVTYHKDGSGELKYVFDMGGLKPMLEMAAAMDTTGQMNMDTLGMISKEFVNKVEGLKGITNIAEISDADNLKFGVSFNFDDPESLNTAVNQLMESPGLMSGETTTFEGSKKKFTRLASKNLTGIFDEILGETGAGENGEMAMMFLKDVSYTTIYHFDKKVKKMSNDKAVLSDDKKTVTMKYYLFDEDRGGKNATLENEIKLKGWLF